MLDQIHRITQHPAAQAQSGDEYDDDEQQEASKVMQYEPMPAPPARHARSHGEQAVVGAVQAGPAEVAVVAGAGGEAGAGEKGLPASLRERAPAGDLHAETVCSTPRDFRRFRPLLKILRFSGRDRQILRI